MSNPEPVSIDTMLDRIEKSSAEFSDRATVLSETIERVASRLIELPGKTPSRVRDDTGQVEVAFDKLPTWNLWVKDADCETDRESGFDQPDHEPLANVSILRKYRAFPLLVDLLSDIDAQLKSQVAEIDNAMKSSDRALQKPNGIRPTKLGAEKPSGGSQRRPRAVAKTELNDDLPF